MPQVSKIVWYPVSASTIRSLYTAYIPYTNMMMNDHGDSPMEFADLIFDEGYLATFIPKQIKTHSGEKFMHPSIRTDLLQYFDFLCRQNETDGTYSYSPLIFRWKATLEDRYKSFLNQNGNSGKGGDMEKRYMAEYWHEITVYPVGEDLAQGYWSDVEYSFNLTHVEESAVVNSTEFTPLFDKNYMHTSNSEFTDFLANFTRRKADSGRSGRQAGKRMLASHQMVDEEIFDLPSIEQMIRLKYGKDAKPRYYGHGQSYFAEFDLNEGYDEPNYDQGVNLDGSYHYSEATSPSSMQSSCFSLKQS